MEKLLMMGLLWVPYNWGRDAQKAMHVTVTTAVVLWSLDTVTHNSPEASVTEDVTETSLHVATGQTNHTSLIDTSSITVNVADTSGVTVNSKNRINVEGFYEMCNACPGAAEYLSSQAEPAIFRVSVSDCRRPGYDPRSRHGVVYGVCPDSTTFCQFLVQVPQGMSVHARLEVNSTACSRQWEVKLYNEWPERDYYVNSYKVSCGKRVKPVIVTTTNQMFVSCYNSPLLRIYFQATSYRLKVVHTSDFGGYITLHAPQGYYLTYASTRDQLTVPNAHAVMTSFKVFSSIPQCLHSVSLLWTEGGKIESENVLFVERDFDRTVTIIHSTVLAINITFDQLLPADFETLCLKMLFSFHPVSRVPLKVSSNTYNCSVDYFPRFQPHLDCNLKVECEDGRDEAGHCPYSSPACQGWVASYGKCYKRFSFDKSISNVAAGHECQRHGLRQAAIKTTHELKDFLKLFQGRNPLFVTIGLVSGLRSVPFMYRYLYRWNDDTLIYNAYHVRAYFSTVLKDVLFHSSLYRFRSFTDRIEIKTYKTTRSIACEKLVHGDQPYLIQSVAFPGVQPLSLFRGMRSRIVCCAEGHVTHSFLSCDPKSRCGQAVCAFAHGTSGSTVALHATQSPADVAAMYTCTNDVMIPFSLVCDFRHDCQDRSDESFCQHPLCQGFGCSNGQCVSVHQQCNDKTDCLDDSDETDCALDKVRFHEVPRQLRQYLINLDGKGHFTQHVMNIGEPCPETHYRCKSEWIYCLPVYTRCNGYKDCVYHEDERDCESVTCPGFYRCRDSTVCVHANHMCDGWPQCPQRDDEWLCNMTCPAQCLCQGHAFLCPQPFSAHSFPQLRYLDARGSKMSPSDLRHVYLIHLNLAHCFLTILQSMNCPNLQVMDLSSNQITSITMNMFLQLTNLKILSLRYNPITHVTCTPSPQKQHTLTRLDLSGTRLGVFDSQTIRYFPGLKYLNLSFSSLQSIGPGAFQGAPHLQELDVRENFIKNIPTGIFHRLKNLARVRAADHRMCCKDVLPDIFPRTKCSAPQHFLSSCEQLLFSDVHVITFWCVAIFSIAGNLACFIRLCVVRKSLYESGVVIFIACLQCANLCMGIYAIMIAAASETFRGEYFRHEDWWKEGVACKVAGFLCLLSSEVSVLVIFLLTLHHLISLCFPRSAYRFSKRSAAMTCGVTWLVGIVLAFLPVFGEHWGRYGQTGACILMLHDKHQLKEQFGVWHMTVMLNCFVCITVWAALFCIHKTTPTGCLLITASKNLAHVSVDLVMKIAVSDIVVWILITIGSVLVLAGETGSEVNVTMGIMVLPLNSAVNPLLCLWHAMECKWQQQREQRLLRVLKQRGASVSNKTTT